jgi:hypothetical protein
MSRASIVHKLRELRLMPNTLQERIGQEIRIREETVLNAVAQQEGRFLIAQDRIASVVEYDGVDCCTSSLPPVKKWRVGLKI